MSRKPFSPPRFDGIFLLQNALQTLVAPPLLFQKWRRFRARRDAFEWDLARWSAPPRVETGGAPHLVLVAMGFAEARLAAQLTALIHRKRPDIRVTWAIRNQVAAREGGALPAGQNVVPLPFDFAWPVRNWTRAVAPDALIFIEKWQFPILARALHNEGCRVGAVAVRTRDHRGGRYKIGAFYGRWLLGAFEVMGCRSVQELEKLGQTPASTRVRVTGSLKFWPQLPFLDKEILASLHLWLNQTQRPMVAAGSTQPGDEPWVLEAFAPLRDDLNAVLLLAPRHVERAAEVEKLVVERGWKVARRSCPAPDDALADVLLLDTLGELTHAYGAARGAFVGGTLSGTGHNVLEPVAHGIPVFFGPKRGTFGFEQGLCEAAGVGFRVETAQELTAGWRAILTSSAQQKDIATKARGLNEQGAQAWQNTVAAILELVRE